MLLIHPRRLLLQQRRRARTSTRTAPRRRPGPKSPPNTSPPSPPLTHLLPHLLPDKAGAVAVVSSSGKGKASAAAARKAGGAVGAVDAASKAGFPDRKGKGKARDAVASKGGGKGDDEPPKLFHRGHNKFSLVDHTFITADHVDTSCDKDHMVKVAFAAHKKSLDDTDPESIMGMACAEEADGNSHIHVITLTDTPYKIKDIVVRARDYDFGVRGWKVQPETQVVHRKGRSMKEVRAIVQDVPNTGEK